MLAMVVCGRNFTGEMISRIQAKVNAEPDLSRCQLSRQVCEWMDWRKAGGGWKEGSSRKALARMNRDKVLILPERRFDLFKTQVYTAGINYYLKGHNAKVQLNYNWVLEDDHKDQDDRQLREVRNNNLVLNCQVSF